MNEVKKIFNSWIENVKEIELLQELENIKNQPEEIEERFYKDLKFGTAGLRGMIGAGTNRMNIYTVRKVSQGLADYLNEHYDVPVAVISYDSRKNSKKFAFEVAKVMAGNNIKSYITKEMQPTPFLSFSVRNLSAAAGIMITASHNPAEYNGYKCYGCDGAQMGECDAQKVYEKIRMINAFKDVKFMEYDVLKNSELLSFVPPKVYENYFKCIMNQRINKTALKDLKAVYTPLNGAGKYFVKKVLNACGIEDLNIVSCQENADENFSTCPYPNPETFEVYTEAKKLAVLKEADIILATDPDSDRLGVCVKHKHEYKLLSGNEIGVLLCNYLLSQKSKLGILPENPLIVKTIVSTSMVDEIAANYNCRVIEVLTGFKNIASEILKLETRKKEHDFIMGFEESNGYLIGTYARDKDAVSAALLISEMALYYKHKNLTLVDVLNNLKEKYGFFSEKTLSFEFKGSAGARRIEAIMNFLRKSLFKSFEGENILKITDYLNSEVYDSRETAIKIEDVPISNVLSFCFEGGNKIIVRPSGTEPKIKFYIMIKEKDLARSEDTLKRLLKSVNKVIDDIN